MRRSIVFIILALIAMSKCGDVQQCVNDIQESLTDIVDAAKEIRSHHYLQAIEHVIDLVKTIEDEKEVCSGITKQQIEQWVFDHLPKDIQDCINAAATVFIDGKAIKQDVEQGHWGKAIKMIKPLIHDAKTCAQTCEKI